MVKDDSLYVIAIVAVVAVVGLVIMATGSTSTVMVAEDLPSMAENSESSAIAGQAIGSGSGITKGDWDMVLEDESLIEDAIEDKEDDYVSHSSDEDSIIELSGDEWELYWNIVKFNSVEEGYQRWKQDKEQKEYNCDNYYNSYEDNTNNCLESMTTGAGINCDACLASMDDLASLVSNGCITQEEVNNLEDVIELVDEANMFCLNLDSNSEDADSLMIN